MLVLEVMVTSARSRNYENEGFSSVPIMDPKSYTCAERNGDMCWELAKFSFPTVPQNVSVNKRKARSISLSMKPVTNLRPINMPIEEAQVH